MTTHKFMDDTAISEVVVKCRASHIESVTAELGSWSLDNMNTNTRKTKDTIIGPLLHNLPHQLNIGNPTVDRVTQFKLLGVLLKWNNV